MTGSPLPAEAGVLAIDVGGTTIKAEVVDGHGKVHASGSARTPYGEEALGAISELGRRLIDEVARDGGSPVSRAGVVVPGVVDRARGVGVLSSNIGWRHLDLRTPLETDWEVPVLLDHDVTAAGWAEWQTGAGRGCDDLFFVALGTGVAAAIVAGGQLLRGGLGQGGEFGHVIVRPGGPLCACGAVGCLEAVSSAASIAQTYGALVGRDIDGSAEVVDALAYDRVAQRVWDEAIAALADGLIGVVNLLSPARIVLGGGLADAGDALIEPLRDAVSGLAALMPLPQIVRAEFGVRAAVVGAALLARRGGTEE